MDVGLFSRHTPPLSPEEERRRTLIIAAIVVILMSVAVIGFALTGNYGGGQ